MKAENSKATDKITVEDHRTGIKYDIPIYND